MTIYIILSAALWRWGQLSLLTEMSTMILAGNEDRPARKAYVTVIYEPSV
jgi:hypothetical protein